MALSVPRRQRKAKALCLCGGGDHPQACSTSSKLSSRILSSWARGTQSEVSRAVLLEGGPCEPQSEMIRAILLEGSPCCGGAPHLAQLRVVITAHLVVGGHHHCWWSTIAA